MLSLVLSTSLPRAVHSKPQQTVQHERESIIDWRPILQRYRYMYVDFLPLSDRLMEVLDQASRCCLIPTQGSTEELRAQRGTACIDVYFTPLIPVFCLSSGGPHPAKRPYYQRRPASAKDSSNADSQPSSTLQEHSRAPATRSNTQYLGKKPSLQYSLSNPFRPLKTGKPVVWPLARY